MESNKQQESSNMMDWLIFFVSTAVMIAMLIWMNEWFWLALPFSMTYFVKALRLM